MNSSQEPGLSEPVKVEFQTQKENGHETNLPTSDGCEDLTGSGAQKQNKAPSCLSRVKDVFGRIVPHGGIASSVFNLASVCLGAGILGLPAAANSSGLVMAFIYLFLLSGFGIYSLHILGKTMEKTKYRTFESMAKGLIGHRFDYCVSCIRWINSFGATIAYVISIGDVMAPILEKAPGVPSQFRDVLGRRIVTSLVWFFILIPLVLPKQVNTLRYVSAVAVLFVVYFVLVIVIHASIDGLGNLNHIDGVTIRLFNTGNAAIHGLGVFMFAFVCQINCYEIYWEMKDRSSANFTRCGILAIALCFLAYGLTVFFGYIDFGSAVRNSILLMYDPTKNAMVMVGYIGILIKLCASYALQTMAYRNTIYHLIGWDPETLAYWKHILFVVIFSTVVLICGLFIPNINIVFGLVGAICGGFLSFIFPSLFYMYSGNWTLKQIGPLYYFATYALLLAGVIGIVFGTVAAFDGTING